MATDMKEKINTKVLALIVAGVILVCAIVTAVVEVSKNKEPLITTIPEATGQSEGSTEGSTFVPSQTEPSSSTTVQGPVSTKLSDDIIGKWMDSANMSGFEFFPDGRVTVTYVNLVVPVIELPINGTANGTYSVSENTVTVNFSIYAKTITKSYEATVVPKQQLSMKNKEDGEVTTLAYVSENTTVPSAPASTSSPSLANAEIIGDWYNSDSSINYRFNADSTVSINYANAMLLSVSDSPLNGSYKGIFISNGNALTIQFKLDDKNITQVYSFSVSENTMTLTDSNGSTLLLVKKSASSAVSGDSIIGKWTDSANMSGFNFKDGGVVEVTFVNITIPVINMPINGTYPGTYTIDGNKVTVAFSIYGKTISNTYEYTLSGSQLSLKNVEDGKASTYTRTEQ